jgi:hypothetical protein
LAALDPKRLLPKVGQQLRGLLRGEFVDRRENILVLGPPGSGKTRSLCAMAQELVRCGRRLLFTTTALLPGQQFFQYAGDRFAVTAAAAAARTEVARRWHGARRGESHACVSLDPGRLVPAVPHPAPGGSRQKLSGKIGARGLQSGGVGAM